MKKIFFDGFVVFGLGGLEIGKSGIRLEGFEGLFDGFFDELVMSGAFFGLTRGFDGGFDNRHEGSCLNY